MTGDRIESIIAAQPGWRVALACTDGSLVERPIAAWALARRDDRPDYELVPFFAEREEATLNGLFDPMPEALAILAPCEEISNELRVRARRRVEIREVTAA